MEGAPAFSPNAAKSTPPNGSPVERNVRVRSISDPATKAGASKPRHYACIFGDSGRTGPIASTNCAGRNATFALDQSDNPAPTSVICGAFSKTAALMADPLQRDSGGEPADSAADD